MLQAYSKSELLSILTTIDISVPKRSEGRTKEHTERYGITHLLSTLTAEDQLSYPLCLIRRERPDFLLTLGRMQIGVELTEAIHQNEAHKDKLREDMKWTGASYISPGKFEEDKKSAEELMKEIQENPLGRGWEGDLLEKEWSDIMFHFVERKAVNLRKDGFDKFEQNWLFIYNNSDLHLIDDPSEIKAVEFLRKEIDDKKAFNEFDKIYILTGSQLLELSSERTQFYPINNLWKQE